MYTIINAQCVDQALTITNLPKIASGGSNEVRVEIKFCELWDGLGKVAVFYRKKNKVFHVVLEDDACLVPWEVLTEPGTVHFGVIGATTGITRTSDVVALKVEQGAITSATNCTPLPEVYQQILAVTGALTGSLAVERSRIDNLIAGGTSDGAEVEDIRVGYNGVTHDSAGTAVRAQFMDFAGLVGVTWLADHYVNNTGAVWEASGRKCSSFIPCVPGVALSYVAETGHSGVSGLTFYDVDYNAIGVNSNVGDNGTVCSTVAPEGARYLRISTSDAIGWLLTPDSALALAAIVQNTADIKSTELAALDEMAYQAALNGANAVDLTLLQNSSGVTFNADGSISVAAGGYMFVPFAYRYFSGAAYVGVVSSAAERIAIGFSVDGIHSATVDSPPYVYTRTLHGVEVATIDKQAGAEAYPYAILRIDNRSGADALTISMLKIVDGGAPANDGVCFVSPDGLDTNPGTLQSPFATVNRALQSGASTVYLREGAYLQNIDLSLSVFKELTIASYDGTGRAVLVAPDSLISATEAKVDGYSKVYSAPCSETFSSANLWIFQDGVPDERTLISDAERHPLQRGQAYRCLDTMLERCTATTFEEALAEIEAAEDFKWFADEGVLYFSRPNSITESNPLRGSFGTPLFANGTRAMTLHLVGIESKYQGINVSRTNGSTLTDCKASNTCHGGAFEYDQCLGVTFTRCEAARCFYGSNGDGFNAHSFNTGDPLAKQTTASLVDCWSHDNNDDGYSDHERSETTIIGGLFEYNGKAGVTPSYGSHCTCYDVTSRRNYAGFYCCGEVAEAEGGVHTQMTCHGCIAENNTRGGAMAGFRVDGAGNGMQLTNCRAIGNGTGYIIGNGDCRAKLVDCTALNNELERNTVGTWEIIDTSAVSANSLNIVRLVDATTGVLYSLQVINGDLTMMEVDQ